VTLARPWRKAIAPRRDDAQSPAAIPNTPTVSGPDCGLRISIRGRHHGAGGNTEGRHRPLNAEVRYSALADPDLRAKFDVQGLLAPWLVLRRIGVATRDQREYARLINKRGSRAIDAEQSWGIAVRS